MSKKIYENFFGRLETVRNRQQVKVNGSYVNTAQNKNSAANGGQILSLVTPSCVVLRSVTVAVCGVRF